jgi:hypothetical protein
MPKMPAVRVVELDPETQNGVTTSFNSLEEMVEWANKKIAEKKKAD